MNDNTEWEIVDEPSAPPRQTPRDAAQAVLGRWWKWKLAAIAVVATVVLVFFATVIGIAILVMAAAAILSIVIGKLLRWLRGMQTGSALTHKGTK